MMDSDEEIVGGARPKRLTRPPAYLEQYEVQFPRGRPVSEPGVTHTVKTPVSPWSLSFQPCVALPGGDRDHPDGSQILSPSYQLTEPAVCPQQVPSSHSATDSIAFAHLSELQQLRHERAAFEADLRELRAVRAEVQELVQAARSLRADLSQSRVQPLSPVQPSAMRLSSTPVKPSVSTPVADGGPFPDLPPPPWPEPDAALARELGALELSDAATSYRPVVPGSQQHPLVLPITQSCPPERSIPDAGEFPPPPTPQDLRKLLASSAMPLPAHRQSAPAYPSIPASLPQSEPRVRPVIPPSETVYRGPPPTIPKFTRPDPSEFARLRIALENLFPPDGTELFKYQILVDHLKLEDAKMIADANLNSPTPSLDVGACRARRARPVPAQAPCGFLHRQQSEDLAEEREESQEEGGGLTFDAFKMLHPFTDTMSALREKYGQPHQLALRRIASVLDSPDVRRGDIPAFQRFALQVQSLVGLLRTLGHDGELELSCGSHVARLLNKLPPEQRAEFRRHMFRQPGSTPNLVDFSNWLRYETSCHSYDAELMPKSSYAGKRSVAILHGVGTSSAPSSSWSPPTVESAMPRRGSVQPAKPANTKRYCPFCNASEHYLSQCTSFAQITPDKVKTWIRSHSRCWRCARSHHAAQCDLKKQPSDDPTELRKSTFCGVVASPTTSSHPDRWSHSTWLDLLDATARNLRGDPNSDTVPEAADYRQAEVHVLKHVQQESFPEDYHLLESRKTVKPNSRLVALAPEMDPSNGLIRVGGRLRRVADLADSILHPIVLDSRHPVAHLIIRHYDNQLHHPGSERLFAEIRRHYWILRGREAVRRFQHTCPECRRWRGKPSVPLMSDLPCARLQLYKPAFHSCGMDCFGPFLIKIGRRTEKRWGVLFKCLTTRAVHLDLLPSLSTDSFLMALRRFIARRGTPAQLWSDQGTNFRGGERELREAYAALAPDLQRHLVRQKIQFCFNRPAAPHFGVWEREVRSVKSALYTVLGSQSVPEEVLMTVLLEVEAILNSKPLGYVSSDVADADPVTPSSLLMGRPDGSLPQVIYPESEMLSRRRWRHSQILADRFWSRFIRDYLPSLQTRQKWQASPPDLQKHTYVMIVDPQLPRGLWPVGKVIQTHVSPDGHVRSADVQIKNQIYTHPVARLVVLPTLPSDDPGASNPPG
ncbi:hypothetical protein M9458_051818 [Cirrhinus mrigala]|uniref:Integrase catalytic domain-containing protein n=1 Tax=Cirrhinus mrigala TaxID=683832 RepID=A0ABD0MS67_CIRMR